MINLQEFKRFDLRVGEICETQAISGADNLLKIKVNLDQEQKILVAGIAKYYTPEELIGLKVIVLTNLEPAIIHGVLSEGMILGTGCSNKEDIALLTVNKEVPNGSRVE